MMRRCGHCGKRCWPWQISADFAEISFHEACYYVWSEARQRLFAEKRRLQEIATDSKRMEMEARIKGMVGK